MTLNISSEHLIVKKTLRKISLYQLDTQQH